MEKGLRKSSRQAKPLRDSNFVYDIKGVRSRARVSSSSESSTTDSLYPASDNSGKIDIATNWSNFVDFPTSDIVQDNFLQDSRDYAAIQREKETICSRRRSHNTERRPLSVEQEEDIFVNNTSINYTNFSPYICLDNKSSNHRKS